MAYQVDRFNGTFLVSVEDGTIDTTTDLRFVGKNYAGYGELQNENFLHLLENFSNTTPPPKAIEGQIWYDKNNKKLKFFDGSKFKIVNGADVSTTAPAGLQLGEFWFDPSGNQLYTWNGTEFVLVGPSAPLDLGASAAISAVVKDTTDTNRVILKLISAGKTIGIVSRDEFRLKPAVSEDLVDFAGRLVKKGFTVAGTNDEGVSGDNIYWGTASNSLKLGGLAVSEFLRRGSIAFTEDVSFDDSGYTLGDSNDLKVKVDDVNIIFESQLGNTLTFRITEPSVGSKDIAIISGAGVIPGSSDSYILGSNSNRWQAVYATTFNGDLVGNVQGSLTGEYRGNIFASDNTVAYDFTNKIFYGQVGTSSDTVLVFGNVQGNLSGTANNASALNNFVQSESAVPLTVVLRDASGIIRADRFEGAVSQAESLQVNGSAYRLAATSATANTVAARDGSGNLSAVIFNGTATAARYADLAEKYLTDIEYDVGTVVMIGGDAEVTAAKYGKRAIGVVSANPAFMMNKDLEGGTYIALKGRVPVKVKGKVTKGDSLIASDTGIATVAKDFETQIFAIAIETNENIETKLIEAIVL